MSFTKASPLFKATCDKARETYPMFTESQICVLAQMAAGRTSTELKLQMASRDNARVLIPSLNIDEPLAELLVGVKEEQEQLLVGYVAMLAEEHGIANVKGLADIVIPAAADLELKSVQQQIDAMVMAENVVTRMRDPRSIN